MSVLTTRTTGGLVAATVLNGGSGYESRPTVTVVGGGGAGAAVVANMAGTQVESLVITNKGAGYTGNPTLQFVGGGGTGASATVVAQAGPLRPISIFRGRFNDVYGVDGAGRGFRWDGASGAAEPIGIAKPVIGPSVAAETGGNLYVSSVQVVKQGSGYTDVPTVTIAEGSPTRAAKARARLAGGKVTGFTLDDTGLGYDSTPIVTVSGGIGTGAVLGVGVLGSVDQIYITNAGTGYDGSAQVVFSTVQGLTGAAAAVRVVDGKLDFVRLFSGGTGATMAGATAYIVSEAGTGASLGLRMAYRVSSVSVVAPGSGYRYSPIVTFRRAVDDTFGGGAAATAYITDTEISSVSVYAGGQYEQPPEAIVRDQRAAASAIMEHGIKGKYKCCIRYLDDTPEARNGPIPSSISELVTVDATNGAGRFVWSFDHPYIEPRVTKMELWRTTSDQSVVLFRVATIARTSPAFFGSYEDSLSDAEMIDTERDGYGIMPVTLPSGQLNARRFGVPPGNYAVACMFQDRAWYAVDTTGASPNSLLYSEVDEPESVPVENELLLQENTGSPDVIVGLVPVGSALLVCQRRHIYKLQYVAQPVLDASITLVSHRGLLNQRCWTTLGGVTFLVDESGMYAFDGTAEQPVSVPVDNYWRDGIIDFSLSRFFHVSSDSSTQTVRFFYCKNGDSLPGRALCYSAATKAWWEETYPEDITSSAIAEVDGKRAPIYGTGDGTFITPDGLSDNGAPVPYQMKTGNFALEEGATSRAVGIMYKPTASSVPLDLAMHYNNSSTPRQNAVATDRGGFTTATGSTVATLNLASSRSPLGDSNGFARAYLSGHRDDRNVGGDRHVAVAIAGTQGGTNAADAVNVYSITIEGAQ